MRWGRERGWDRRLLWTALAMIIGNLMIYVLGVTWLAVSLGDLGTALVKGALAKRRQSRRGSSAQG